MSDDQELLEHAAKAYGLTVDRFSEAGDHVYTNSLGKWWSSLVVDGDCFRMAMGLDISVIFDERERCTIAEWGDGERLRQYWEGMVLGKTEATRYVITRAAAQIWAMKQTDQNEATTT